MGIFRLKAAAGPLFSPLYRNGGELDAHFHRKFSDQAVAFLTRTSARCPVAARARISTSVGIVGAENCQECFV